MKKQKLSLEIVYEVWDDETGTHIEIGEDRDGIQLVEIRTYEGIVEPLEPFNRLTFTVGEAELLAQSLLRVVEDMRKKYPECEASVM